MVTLGSFFCGGTLLAQEDDPFAGVKEASAKAPQETSRTWKQYVMDNLGFRKEIMSEFVASEKGRNVAAQPVIVCAIDFAHAAFAHKRNDFVRTEPVTCRDRHMLDLDSLAGPVEHCADRYARVVFHQVLRVRSGH